MKTKKQIQEAIEGINQADFIARLKDDSEFMAKITSVLKRQKYILTTSYVEDGEKTYITYCQNCGATATIKGYGYARTCNKCGVKAPSENMDIGYVTESNDDFAVLNIVSVRPSFEFPPLDGADPFDCLYSAKMNGVLISPSVSRYVLSWKYGIFYADFGMSKVKLRSAYCPKAFSFLENEAFEDLRDRMLEFKHFSKDKTPDFLKEVFEESVSKYRKPTPIKRTNKLEEMYKEFAGWSGKNLEEKIVHKAALKMLSSTGILMDETSLMDDFKHELKIYCPLCLKEHSLCVDLKKAKSAKDNDEIEVVCPHCGITTTIPLHYFVNEHHNVFSYCFQRRVDVNAWEKYDDETLVVRLFRVTYSCDRTKKSISRKTEESQRVFITPKKMFLLTNEADVASPKKFEKDSFTSFSNYCYYGGRLPEVLNSNDELKDMVQNSAFKYSGFLEAWGLSSSDVKPINAPGEFSKTSYVYSWVHEHCLEQLLKTGFTKIVKDVCYNKGQAGMLADKRATSTPKILGIDRHVMKIGAELDLTFNELSQLSTLVGVDPQVDSNSISYIMTNRIDASCFTSVYKTLGIPINRQVKYIKEAVAMQCISRPASAAADWADYIRMAKECGYKLKSRDKRYPAALTRDHAIVNTVYNCLKRDFDEKAFAEKAEANSKFNYSNKELGLFAIAPKSPDEVVNEGMSLHHCVSSYVNPILQGLSIVMFIRKHGDEETPYYTAELKDGNPVRITQIKGDMNTDPDYLSEEGKILEKFITKWCKANHLVLDIQE